MDFTSKEQEYLDRIKELGESGSPELSALCRRAWADSQTGEISQKAYSKIYSMCMEYAYPR